jgi:HPr kinase/phosphorylase
MSVTIAELYEAKRKDLALKLISGEGGLKNRVSIPRVQKPGLALAGFLEQVHPRRLQVIGKTEIAYLKTLTAAEAESAITRVCQLKIAAFILTSGLAAPESLLSHTNLRRIPLIKSPLRTAPIIRSVTGWLEDVLAPTTTLHVVLVEVLGIGILILGKSGIGKSELALDLISRGHRLVADDVVEIKKTSGDSLTGSGTPLLHHHMEIRGLGIIDVQQLFGTIATRDQKHIDLIVELEDWEPGMGHERIGIEESTYTVLGVPLTLVKIPVTAARSLAPLIELAARNQILKEKGVHSALEFSERLDRELRKAGERG